MDDKFITVKEVVLKNNCPECYNNEGLRLTFKQRFIETKFYKSITADIKHNIACKTCNSIIYPVQWTEDIERVFEYQKKAFTPKKVSKRLKKAFWIAIGVAGFIIASALFIFIYNSL